MNIKYLYYYFNLVFLFIWVFSDEFLQFQYIKKLHTETPWQVAVWFHASKNVNAAAYQCFCQRHFFVQFILNCFFPFLVQML